MRKNEQWPRRWRMWWWSAKVQSELEDDEKWRRKVGLSFFVRVSKVRNFERLRILRWMEHEKDWILKTEKTKGERVENWDFEIHALEIKNLVFFRDFERDFEESASKSSGDEIFWNNWKTKGTNCLEFEKLRKWYKPWKIKNSEEENWKMDDDMVETVEKEEEELGWGERKKERERVSAAAAVVVRHTPASGDAVGPLTFSGLVLLERLFLSHFPFFKHTPREWERKRERDKERVREKLNHAWELELLQTAWNTWEL